MKKILISTGGSGGHIIPAVTLFEHFKNNFSIYLATDKRGSRFIDQKKYKIEIFDTPKIQKNILKIPFILIVFIFSIVKSYFFLKKKNIDLLISTGGYMSSPFCLAAKFLNIKIFLFEPNMVLGRSNKFFLGYSKKIICYSENIKNFPNKYKDKIYRINPLIRKEIYDYNKNKKNENKSTFKIMILGGSQGAKFFDENMKELIINLSKKNKISLIQQISDINKIEQLTKEYNAIKLPHEIFSFTNELHVNFENIDFVITRSGASTISELAFLNIPFLAIPFPHAKDDHQFYNAKKYLDNKLCWLIRQNDFRIQETTDFLSNLISNKEEYFLIKENMKKFSYKNTWNNVNQKLINLINEN